MKKWLKTGALVAALVLILGIGWFANALVGNPVSKWLAARTAEKHLEEVYGETDFVLERVAYNFKDGNYYVHIKSPTSEDSSFYLCMNMWGVLERDTYESRVLSGNNTADRLYMEYRDFTGTVFESPEYPFTSFITYGDLRVGFDTPYLPVGEDLPAAGYIVLEELVLDKQYDMKELGALAGRLVVYVEDDEVTVERAAEVLLELKQLFDDAGVTFYAIDFVLEYPRLEEGGTSKEGRVETQEFLYADIYEEGMIERVKAANEAANEYYEERDWEKDQYLEQEGEQNE